MKKKKNLKEKLTSSVKLKILVPILIVSAVVCISQGVVLGSRMSRTTKELAAGQALAAARFTAEAVNVDEIIDLRPGDENSAVYIENAEALEDARKDAGVLFAYTLTTDGERVYYGVESAQEEPIGSEFEEDYEFLKTAFLGGEIQDTTIYHTEDGVLISCYVPLRDSTGKVVSIIGCDYDAQEISNKTRTNITLVVYCTVMGLVMLGLVATLVISRVLRPLSSTTEVAAKMRRCDLSETKNMIHSKDEIGELSHTFCVVADGLREIITDIRYQLGEMSSGNYCAQSRCPERYQGDYNEINEALTNIRQSMNDTLMQISIAISQVNDGTAQIADGAQELSVDSSEQTSAVTEISDAIQRIAEDIGTTAKGADAAVESSRTSSVHVEESNRCMKEFADAMAEIDDKSKKIGSIIQTIDSIAFQTNILALNAAVEAARAGEAGKGFSVVADEVRMLAQKSAEAARDTGNLIEETIGAISRSITLAKRTETALEKVAESTLQSESRITEISEACNRQAEGTELINQHIQHIMGVVQSNSALSEETAATCEELSAQTEAMNDLMKRFRIQR